MSNQETGEQLIITNHTEAYKLGYSRVMRKLAGEFDSVYCKKQASLMKIACNHPCDSGLTSECFAGAFDAYCDRIVFINSNFV